MTVGVLTFYNVPNYGAFLQAWALSRYLGKRGHNVSFIPALFSRPQKPSLIFILYKLLRMRRWDSALHQLKYRRSFTILKDLRGKLPELLGETVSYGSLKRDPPVCDCLVVGSDQVWGPSRFNSDMALVMLDFARSETKRISYAASFGRARLLPQYESGFREYVQKFDAVGVRETSGIQIVGATGYAGVCEQVPDPTLLHDAITYDQLIHEHNAETDSKYIFDYFLGWNVADREKYIPLICNKLGITEVKYAQRKSKSVFYRLLGVADKISLSEWIKGIRDSEFVLTNSFHGIVFAILYKRPFICVGLAGEIEWMNERVVSLLNILGLEDRIIYSFDEEKVAKLVVSQINWDLVMSKIEVQRKKANAFLSKSGI